MAMTDNSIVAGVFIDETQAQQAMSDLQNAGFTDDQIRYSVHRGGSGILDALMGLGFGQDEANFYNNEFMNGRTVVTVKTNDRQQQALDILRRYGGYDFNSQSQRAGTAYTDTGYSDHTTQSTGTAYNTTQTSGATYTQAQAPQTDYTDQGGQKVQLREEELRANKERVQAGEVGIRKDVVSEEKTLNVPVNREEVYIERHPVSGEVPADTPIGDQGETYRVPVSEERVNVEKQPVVREEIGIGKRTVQDTEQVTDTVRREEAHVERRGDVNVQGDNTVDNTSTNYNS